MFILPTLQSLVPLCLNRRGSDQQCLNNGRCLTEERVLNGFWLLRSSDFSPSLSRLVWLAITASPVRPFETERPTDASHRDALLELSGSDDFADSGATWTPNPRSDAHRRVGRAT